MQAVKVALGSDKTVADKIAEIVALELPNNAAPLIVLVHGDSTQLKSVVSYAENDNASQPSKEEIIELIEDLSAKIITKLERYLTDWDSGNTYRYRFEIKASYGVFKNELGDIEYIDIVKNYPDIKTVGEAIQEARNWQSLLLERIKLYQNQETGHKLISVKPTYIIQDSNGKQIAAGTLQGNNEFGISTWLNQN